MNYIRRSSKKSRRRYRQGVWNIRCFNARWCYSLEFPLAQYNCRESELLVSNCVRACLSVFVRFAVQVLQFVTVVLSLLLVFSDLFRALHIHLDGLLRLPLLLFWYSMFGGYIPIRCQLRPCIRSPHYEYTPYAHSLKLTRIIMMRKKEEKNNRSQWKGLELMYGRSRKRELKMPNIKVYNARVHIVLRSTSIGRWILTKRNEKETFVVCSLKYM